MNKNKKSAAQIRHDDAKVLAFRIMRDYGGDYDAASDRFLALCNGNRRLERLVSREALQYANRRAA